MKLARPCKLFFLLIYLIAITNFQYACLPDETDYKNDVPSGDNPYAVALNEWLHKKVSLDISQLDHSGDHSRTIGRYILNRTWGLTHPLSRLTDPFLIKWHQEQIKKEVAYLLDVSEKNHGRMVSSGRWNVDRFVLRRLLDAFYRLNTAGLHMEEMPEWMERAKLSIEYQYTNYWSGPSQEDLPGWNNHAGHYPNSDVMYVLLMGIAGKLYDEPRYLDRAHEFVVHLKNHLLPAGAFN